jgi:hypothetical protein
MRSGAFTSGGSMPIVANNIGTLILTVNLRQDFPLTSYSK